MCPVVLEDLNQQLGYAPVVKDIILHFIIDKEASASSRRGKCSFEGTHRKLRWGSLVDEGRIDIVLLYRMLKMVMRE